MAPIRWHAGAVSALIVYIEARGLLARTAREDGDARPVVVTARPGPDATVISADASALDAGVTLGMPAAAAMALLPAARFVPLERSLQLRARQTLLGALGSFADTVEPVSASGAFFDVPGDGGPDEVHRRVEGMTREIEAALVCPIVAAAAPSKIVARTLARRENEGTVAVVTAADDAAARLRDLPLGDVLAPIVPAGTVERLRRAGVTTVAEFLDAERAVLEGVFDPAYVDHLQALCRGDDPSPVRPASEPTQVSRQETFERYLIVDREVDDHIRAQARAVALELRIIGRRARRIAVRVGSPDFETVTRMRTLYSPTNRTEVIEEIAGELINRLRESDRRPIQVLALIAEELSRPGGEQLSLLDDPA